MSIVTADDHKRVEIPDAKPEDFKKATEQVFHNSGAASGVEVMVLQ